MTQAIITKKVARGQYAPISAECYSARIVVPCTPGLDTLSTHRKAAEALRDHLNWTGTLIGGSLPDESGYAFVFADESC